MRGAEGEVSGPGTEPDDEAGELAAASAPADENPPAPPAQSCYLGSQPGRRPVCTDPTARSCVLVLLEAGLDAASTRRCSGHLARAEQLRMQAL